mgnify:CR=1 FL=1
MSSKSELGRLPLELEIIAEIVQKAVGLKVEWQLVSGLYVLKCSIFFF